MPSIVLNPVSGLTYGIELSFNNREEHFFIPVLPESIEVKEEGQGKSYNIVGKGGGTSETRSGEVNVIKSPKLREVSFSSIFPAAAYPFISVNPNVLKLPFEYIDLIRKWWATKRPIRFIFVGSRYEIITATGAARTFLDYDINIPASIESFTWKEVAGSPGDLEYTLNLKEYVFYSARSVVPVTLADGTIATITESPKRPDERVRPDTITLPASNSLLRSLMSAAHRYYDMDSTRMRDIQKLNGFTDADLMGPVAAGTVIKLPVK